MTIELVRLSLGRSGTALSLASFLLLAACGSDSPTSPVEENTDNASGHTSDGSGDSDGTTSDDGDSTGGAIDGGPKVTPKLDASVKDSGPAKAADASAAAGDGSTAVVKTNADAAAHPTSGDAGVDASKPTPGADSGPAVVADAGPAALPPDPGKGDGSDVVTIGDSWMDNTLDLFEDTGGGIAAALQRDGFRYKNYAIQGTKLVESGGLGTLIPLQWDQATREKKNIKTVVMTGGGNDILLDDTLKADCAAGGTKCDDELKKLGLALLDLWNKMSAAGVQDIVHVLYAADAADNTLIKQAKKNNDGLMLLCSLVKAPARCHLIESDALIKGQYAADGIHPTAAANDRIAAAVEKLMADQHIRR